MVSGETVTKVLEGVVDTTLADRIGTTRNYKNIRNWVDDHELIHSVY